MRTPRPRFRRLLLITTLVSASPAAAQTPLLEDVRAGSRVQLMLRDSLRQQPILPARQIVTGRFVRATADSVWVRPAGASELGVARSTITRARVSRGASRLRSALAFGAGLGFGFAVTVVVDRADTGGDHRAQDALVAGAVGFGAGMLIGALSPYEHWRSLRP